MKLIAELFDPERLSPEDLKAFVGRYRNDPVRFVREILQLDPDANQVSILEAIRDNDYVAVASGRGIGKSWLLAMVAIWVLATRPGAKVPVLSNTDAQCRTTLWPPLVSILKRSLIASWFDHSSERVWFKGDPETAFIQRVTWSENSIESVSGWHSRYMVYLCDEASGMPDALLTNLYASCTEDWNRMLLMSNATRSSGYFHDRSTDPRWHFVSIDSRSSAWTDKDKIADLMDTYGEDSDQVRVQVKGMFPRYSSMSIVPEGLVMAALHSSPQVLDSDVVSIGLDVGGGGDPTVWVVRRGLRVIFRQKEETRDNDEPIIAISAQLARQYRATYLVHDKTGLGTFLGPKLQAVVPTTCTVLSRNFGEGSPEEDCYNMRSWMYRRVWDWFRLGPDISEIPDVARQLMATEYRLDDNGRLKLIPKDAIKAQLEGQSPDDADALALSCAYQGDLCQQEPGANETAMGLHAVIAAHSGWMPSGV